jgi:hypothetical protein
VDGLPGLLTDAAQRNERTDWLNAGLFFEFSARGVEEIFTFFDDAFRNRPRAGVAILPEWTSGMGDEYFQSSDGPPEQQ